MSRTNRCLEPVVQGLTERIMEGVYAPGERLPTENQMQVEWGVSRSVVREAMKMLTSQGLVRIEQGRGTFVDDVDDAPLRRQLEWALRRSAPPAANGAENGAENGGAKPKSAKPKGGKRKTKNVPPDQWDHLLDVRTVLEIATAERAARQASPDDIAAMQASIDKMRRYPDKPAGYIDADLEFHRALVAATKNPLWPALLNSLNDLLRHYIEIAYHGPRNALMAAEQHEAILEAILRRDVIGAAQAMSEHLKTSEQDLSVARSQQRA